MPLPGEYLPATEGAQQELVLLHGWGSNREVWRPLLVMLRPWANITLLDLPGCAPGCNIHESAGLSEVLAAIVESCPAQAVYMGWSLGGQLAVELASRYPDRVLAVVTLCSNPRFVAADGWPGMDAAVFAEFCAHVDAGPRAALQRFDTLQVKGSAQPRSLLRQLRKYNREGACARLQQGLGWLATLDQRDRLSTLAAPQLHILAQQDNLVPVSVERSMVEQLPAHPLAQIKVLDGACHFAPLEAAVGISREVVTFLTASDLLHAPSDALLLQVAKTEVAASFSRAATHYDSVAQLQRNVGEHLFGYLESVPFVPETVLDLGCGTGYFRSHLQKRYPATRYLGLDLAPGMVSYARSLCPVSCDWIVADAEAVPLASDSVDLVFSSLAIQWCPQPRHLFAELARVLRPGGRCVFTTLGPDTLKELRSSWAAVDTYQHVNTFLPARELLLAAEETPGIAITLESQNFCMEYERVRDLLAELKTLGAHNMNQSRPTGLASRQALQGMLQAYEQWRGEGGLLPATYDVVFGILEKK